MPEVRTVVEGTAEAASRLAGGLADAVQQRGWGVATAESLTGGTIASMISAAPGASGWFRGSVVAYSTEVKFNLLGVPRGAVVTEECAATMALRTGELLGADLCLAVTGVGGPNPDEGEPAGTVWFAVASPKGVLTQKVVFDGPPPAILAATVERALGMLHQAATGAA